VRAHFAFNPFVSGSLDSPDRTVSTLLAAQPSNRSSIPSTSKGLFSFPKGSGRLSRYNKPAIQAILEAVLQGLKRLGPETDLSPPYGVEVKKEWRYRSTAKKWNTLELLYGVQLLQSCLKHITKNIVRTLCRFLNGSSSTTPTSSALFQCAGNTSETEMLEQLLAAKLSYYFFMKICRESKCFGGAQP